VRRDLDEETDQALRSMARANLDPTPVAPGGEASLMMNIMASENPAAFAKEDLRLIRGKVAPEEYARFGRIQQGLVSSSATADAPTRRRMFSAMARRNLQSVEHPGGAGLVNASYQDVPEPIPPDELGKTSIPADVDHEESIENKVNTQFGATSARRRGLSETMSAPLSRDFYAANPGFSFFDYPVENPDFYRWHLNGKGIAAGALELAAVLPWGRAVGFLRTELSAADKVAVNLVPRLGQKGVDAAHNNANVLVRDASGKIVTHRRLVSGNMTAEEKALGYPKGMLASHTEVRAVRGIDLRLGDTVTITGHLPPCIPCRGAMNRAATETGATIKYQWRQGGKTITWTATPKRK